MKKMRVWLPAFLWMGFIFLMSAQTGEDSSAQSGFIVDLLLSLRRMLLGDAPMDAQLFSALELLIRKAAHMSEYAVLSLLYLRALRLEDTAHPYAKALLLCGLYAASDEFHQAFVPDRGPSPVDVMIDTAGGAIGLTLDRLYLHLRS